MIALLMAKHADLFQRKQIFQNIVAGIIVGVVALPLAMAFAIASGAKPEQGLYTAIIAGLLTSAFGGSLVQIAGPTGAFIVILSGITAKYGIIGLQVATVMAGVMLFLMGWARLGNAIRYIPTPVIVGFTTGIAVIIFVGQWQDFFGLPPIAHSQYFHEKLWLLFHAFAHLNLNTTALALFSLFLMLISPFFLKRVPAPLIAMVIATVLQSVFHFKGVATIGSAFGGIPQGLPTFHVPTISAHLILALIGPAFTIAMLGAIESLLSAVVADGMSGTRHNSNQELMGQGVSNIVAPFFGGFASTGAIARTATNIRNGGTNPIAGITHSVTLILIMLLLAPLASNIPLCALSAILFVVAYNMSEMHRFAHIIGHAPRSDILILLLTFFLTVFVNLVVAVNIGVILAALIFMHRMAQTVNVESIDERKIADEMEQEHFILPSDVVIYSINGPLFFGAAETFEHTMISIHASIKTVIIRLSAVPLIDGTGLEALADMIEQFQKRHIRIILCEATPKILSRLHRAKIDKLVGQNCIFDRLSDAISEVMKK
ncbi:MAG: SulP family inorganic anion transporter [Gammaproteobacteria bacterium]|nr:SulP family inorganic anion transporter [Gammaproteobacteria bacterium]